MKLKILFGLIMIGVYSWALNFSVAPTEFKVDLNKNSIEEVYLMNNTATPLRIETYVETARGYDGKDLNEEIVIFPKKISIRPGGNQTIRFRVKATERELGQYKSLIVFREIPQQIKKEKVDGKRNNFETNLNFVTEIAIGVTGEKRGE